MNSKRVRISRASIRHCPQLAAVISIVLLTASFSLAQTKNPRTAKGEVIAPDRYIVRLRDDIKDPAAVSRDLARQTDLSSAMSIAECSGDFRPECPGP